MTLERRFIDEVASAYEKRGYRVEREALLPREFGLPPHFRADVVAVGPSESVVVEVKSRRNLAAEPAIEQLAAAVRSQPGWRFDLVLMPPPEGESDLDLEASSLSPDQAMAILKEAAEKHHRPSGTSIVSVLGAGEALMRQAANGFGILLDRPIGASALAKTLYAEGHLEERELEFLMAAYRLRNALVHGFRVSPRDTTRLAPEVASLLVRLWQRWRSEFADAPSAQE